MKTFSNRYIFLYSAAVVAVAAVVLAVVAVVLKPLQTRNEQIEQHQMILRAAGIEVPTQEVEATYAREIQEVNLLQRDSLPAFLHGNQCIIRVNGTGLWGPIWGYICFDEQWTIANAVFDHKGETPGLGGEIATPAFAKRFIGKRCSDPETHQFVPLVLKKRADHDSPYEVDAISGGTLTSGGVTNMLCDCLSRYQDCMQCDTSKVQQSIPQEEAPGNTEVEE